MNIEYYCLGCSLVSMFLGGLLTHQFIKNWRNKVIKFFKMDYPDETIEEIVIQPLAITFWFPAIISSFYGGWAFPLLYVPQIQSIDFMTKNNIYIFIIIILILHIILLVFGMTISIITNKRLVTITPSKHTGFWGDQFVNRNILIEEISSISYQYMKIMKINLKNGNSFSFGANNFDKVYEKLKELLKNGENK